MAFFKIENTDRNTRRMNAISRLLLPHRYTRCVAVSIVFSKDTPDNPRIIIGANPAIKDEAYGQFIDSPSLKKSITDRHAIVSKYIEEAAEIIRNFETHKGEPDTNANNLTGLLTTSAQKYAKQLTVLGSEECYLKHYIKDLMKLAKSLHIEKYPQSYSKAKPKDNLCQAQIKAIVQGTCDIIIGNDDNHGVEHAEYLVAKAIANDLQRKETPFYLIDNKCIIGINMLCCSVCYDDIKKFKEIFKKKGFELIVSGTHGETYPGVNLHSKTYPYTSQARLSGNVNLSLDDSTENLQIPGEAPNQKSGGLRSPVLLHSVFNLTEEPKPVKAPELKGVWATRQNLSKPNNSVS